MTQKTKYRIYQEGNTYYPQYLRKSYFPKFIPDAWGYFEVIDTTGTMYEVLGFDSLEGARAYLDREVRNEHHVIHEYP